MTMGQLNGNGNSTTTAERLAMLAQRLVPA
jgi:hypothetical protein